MIELTIGIPTFNRNDLLAKLLNDIVNQSRTLSNVFITVLLADNAMDKSAEKVYLNYKGKLNLEYLHVDTPGIPIVRNAIMNNIDSGYLLFLDDDVRLGEEMLIQVVNYINEYKFLNAILLRKKVQVVKNSAAPLTFYDPALSESSTEYGGDLITTALVININLWDGLYFNEKLQFSGGSDFCFGLDAKDRGWHIGYCANAIVIEEYSNVRSSFFWSIKRNFRYGVVNAVIHTRVRENKSLKMSLKYFLLSLGRATKNLLKGDLKNSLLMLIRCCGVVAGIAGLNFEEYAR